jgi:hypothetical protein
VTVPVPEGTSDTYPAKIDCVSEIFCFAVGTSSHSGSSNSFNLIDEFNGISWSSVDAPNPVNNPQPALRDISCTSATSCVAVGSLFADVLDGTTWSIVSIPSVNGTNQNEIGGVSCVSATSCTAVGSYENAKNKGFAQAATWDGDSWSIESTASLTKNTASALEDVACFSSGSCLAVGSHTVKKHPETALLEQEAANTWSAQVAPTVAPLTLTPDSGNPGTKVTVSGFGFSPNSAVRVRYRGQDRLVTLCSTTTDASGAYSCAATIAKATAGPRGIHQVLAKDGDLEAVDLFTLT